MKKSISKILPDFQGYFPWLEPKEKSIDTLAAFVLDAEHEILAVVTALQAHIDLLKDELLANEMPIDRLVFVNRAIDRLISDATAIAAVSVLARGPRSKKKQVLAKLMEEIALDTRSAFNNNQVLFSCTIAEGTTLTGHPDALKDMITRLVLALLDTCRKLETVRVVGLVLKKRVSLSFETGLETGDLIFKPWRLGDLRLIPTNGDGINISVIDAMARLHHGHLRVSTLSDSRHGFRLILKN